MTAAPLPHDRSGVIVRNFLSRAECDALIAASEEIGYGTVSFSQRISAQYLTAASALAGTAGFDREYRGNLRLMTEDRALSASLWPRVRPHLPASKPVQNTRKPANPA